MIARVLYTLPVYNILAAIPVTVWWKGGKAIDATWLLTCLAIVALLDSIWHRKRLTQSLPWWQSTLLAVFAAGTYVSWLYSEVQNYGFDEVLHTVSLVTIVLWIAKRLYALPIDRIPTIASKVGMLATVTMAVASTIGVLVYIAQPVNRFVGTFFDYRFHTDYWPNAWAQCCLLFLPLVLWYVTTLHVTAKRWVKVFCLLATVLCITAFALSYSRGAMIAALGQLIVWLIVYMRLPKVPIRFTKLTIHALLVAVLVVVSFTGINAVRSTMHEVQSVQDKVNFTAAEGKISINERAQFWQQSIQLIPQKPWFGFGPYAFRFVQPRLQNDVLATSDHPHNVFLKIALERGLVTLLPFVLFIIAPLANFAWRILTCTHTPLCAKQPGLFVAVYIGILGVFAHNLIDYNLQFVGITLPLYLSLGVIAAASFTPRVHTVIWPQLVLIIVLFAALLTEGLHLVEGSKGRAALANEQYQAAIPYLEQSKEQWFSRDTHLSLIDAYVLTNQPEQALQIFNEYRTINHHDSRSWKLRGDACRQQQDYDCALESYSKAWDLSPLNDIAPLRWYIQTLADVNDRSSIDANLPEVDQVINKYQYAIMNGVHHIGLSSNVEELAGLLDLLSTLYPQNREPYQTLKQNIVQKAQKDRDFVAGRKPGVLW